MMQAILGSKPGKEGIWVKVDLSEQLAYIFDGEKEIYRSMISSGKRGYRTRTGKFVITNKYRHWNSTIYGSSMPYFQRLSASDFGFHVGNCPGYAASHGCIRMPNSAAKMLFSLTKTGDYVEIQP
jgi:lipoprotein-anchoring transpeptidase ErfK/SrfK